MKRTPEPWEEDALAFDLTDEGIEKVLSDTICRARKSHICFICRGDVKPGTLQRRSVAIGDCGELLTAHNCEDCCKAMALSWDDDKPLMDRYTLGQQRVFSTQPFNKTQAP